MSNRSNQQTEGVDRAQDLGDEARDVPSDQVELMPDGCDGNGQDEEDLSDDLAQEFSDRGDGDAGDGGEPSPEEVLREECQALKAQLLRERADFDNIRKRLRRDAEEAGQRAVARFVRPLLTQMDNFTLALEAANPEAFADFAMGVTMIRDGLVSVLNEEGISPVETSGAFDPAVHEVVAEIPSDEPKGHIVAVQRQGYQMGKHLVRSAQVLVSKGPSSGAEAANEPSSNASQANEADESS